MWRAVLHPENGHFPSWSLTVFSADVWVSELIREDQSLSVCRESRRSSFPSVMSSLVFSPTVLLLSIYSVSLGLSSTVPSVSVISSFLSSSPLFSQVISTVWERNWGWHDRRADRKRGLQKTSLRLTSMLRDVSSRHTERWCQHTQSARNWTTPSQQEGAGRVMLMEETDQNLLAIRWKQVDRRTNSRAAEETFTTRF